MEAGVPLATPGLGWSRDSRPAIQIETEFLDSDSHANSAPLGVWGTSIDQSIDMFYWPGLDPRLLRGAFGEALWRSVPLGAVT